MSGLLVAGAGRAPRAHGAPLTVVCCDNLPQNGALVAGLVRRIRQLRDPSLAEWIGREIAFPSTMVDRIVPATTADDIAQNDAALQLADAAPVVHEPFAQWVIEDRFAAGRPRGRRPAPRSFDDVEAFESMKLRLLNGSHSAFAYLGFLAGHEFIYQVAAQPEFVAFMRRLMADEVTPTLAAPPGVDLAAYRETLVRRFAQPCTAASHAADRDGRLAEAAAAPARAPCATTWPRAGAIAPASLAVAGWMRYVVR